jgi:hypothetical protein
VIGTDRQLIDAIIKDQQLWYLSPTIVDDTTPRPNQRYRVNDLVRLLLIPSIATSAAATPTPTPTQSTSSSLRSRVPQMKHKGGNNTTATATKGKRNTSTSSSDTKNSSSQNDGNSNGMKGKWHNNMIIVGVNNKTKQTKIITLSRNIDMTNVATPRTRAAASTTSTTYYVRSLMPPYTTHYNIPVGRLLPEPSHDWLHHRALMIRKTNAFDHGEPIDSSYPQGQRSRLYRTISLFNHGTVVHCDPSPIAEQLHVSCDHLCDE